MMIRNIDGERIRGKSKLKKKTEKFWVAVDSEKFKQNKSRDYSGLKVERKE